MGGRDSLAQCAPVWAGQAELVGILLAAGDIPVGDVPAARVVVVSVVTHVVRDEMINIYRYQAVLESEWS